MGTRERILDQSIRAFNHSGTAQVSVLAIATELGISPGNLYYHFRGKEEILIALLAECDLALGRLTKGVEDEIQRRADFEPYLFSLLRVCDHFRFLFRDQEAFRFAHAGLEQKWLRMLGGLRRFSRQLLARLDQIEGLGLAAEPRDRLADCLMLVALGGLSFELEADRDRETQIRRTLGRLDALLRPYQREVTPAH
ncbi:TetR/AcrR family transcriptional regulator [Ferrimonas balearica]|uniref:TetR/AcrR family transcriptional regulator n=1 Tax=Ferrimonas balearica TaxID=44012 RepID=UPI001C98EFA7|nr:TetR/AcrR family transcriptional regulator [Ferrimonas balearica]MBY5993466.1 TetR/AcrR family transcriptional regulator [Ferrimonas balearica]